ncbi:hypothetical protein MJD09_24590 [bacterium]|nr:hypothetical protein [bacterium]
MRRNGLYVLNLWLPACICVLLGCKNDGSDIIGGGDLVTISGFVVNADTGGPATGTRVYLLDHGDQFSAAVDANAQYSLQVPAGTRTLLVVDDADPALEGPSGDWYTMLNYDALFQPTVPEEGLINHMIHGCPQLKGQAIGSIPAWDNYLANGDAANGDLFDVTDTDDASIIVGGFIQAVDGEFSFMADMTGTIDDDDYFVAYIRAQNYFNQDGLPDATLGPDIYYPTSRTATDISGIFNCFVTARTDEIDINFIDSDPTRGISFNSPRSVPVRPNMVTVLFPGHIDGAPNKSPFEVADAGGLFD